MGRDAERENRLCPEIIVPLLSENGKEATDDMKTKLEANYHTHTIRCNHAEGTEREYINQALARGLKVLGFSDHTPQKFDGFYSGFRMRPEQLEDYVNTLQNLRKEYMGQITIYIGLEAEYYPKYYDRLIDLIRPFSLDYLILGQHFTGNESDGEPPCPHPTEDEGMLERYVRQTIEAMETGRFSCFAHPDILNYTGDPGIYRKWYEQLCIRAKELNIPLEMNMLGFVTHRHYPNPAFYRIAAEIGNEVVLGCDAHSPGRVADPAEIEASRQFLQHCGVTNVVDRIRLVPPTSPV